jgi:hypothetical protein
MEQLNKKVERLRAVLLTKEQVNAYVPNLSALGSFSDTDKELMESFKKILHLGGEQLKKFVSDLEDKGKDLDVYSILYYTTQLKNGPLGGELPKIIPVEKYPKYWSDSPDVLGTVVGPIVPSLIEAPIGDLSNVTTFNQSPFTTTKMLSSSIANSVNLDRVANSVLGLGINGCLSFEEAYEGKSYSQRVQDEKAGVFIKSPHGSYLAADTTSFRDLQTIRTAISGIIKEEIGDENFRIYQFKRDYNPYDPSDNVSKSANYVVERKINENDDTIVKTDLVGNVFESDEVRKYKITVSTATKDIDLPLHTVRGQLGDLEPVRVDPLNQ